MKIQKAEVIYQASIYTIISLLLFIMCFPLIYILGQSFLTESEWITSGGKVIIPLSPTINIYKNIFTHGVALFQSFKISVIRTVFGTLTNIFFTMSFGYVLSRKDIPFKRIMLFMLIITLLFGGGLIPAYLVVLGTGIYNTILAYIIPGLVGSWSVLVFRQFFMNVPEEIEESARMDGASEIRIMWAILVPMSLPVIAALSLFTAVGHWNSWFDAVIFVRDENLKPFQLILRNMFQNPDLQYNLTRGQDMFVFDPSYKYTQQSLKMAITVIGTIPILAVYPFLQKYFTKGVYMGSVKG
jgi:putative aldouronate transport system permease protein